MITVTAVVYWISGSLEVTNRLTMASKDEVLSVTGYQLGAVAPVGLNEPIQILVDRSVLDQQIISMGSGVRGTAIILKSADLIQVLENYKIGVYYERENYIDSAIIYYEDVNRKYPQTVWAVKARERLGQLKDPERFMKIREEEIQNRLALLEEKEILIQSQIESFKLKADSESTQVASRERERLMKERSKLEEELAELSKFKSKSIKTRLKVIKIKQKVIVFYI